MSKRSNRKDDFAKFKEKVAKKRRGKEEATTNTDMDYITVQRLSSSVEGRYEKYARIGALTSVPLGCEPTIQNIKEACKHHFDVADGIYCDVLAGERGPSWSETSQISNWKVIHVRFIERSDESQFCEKSEFNTKKQWKSQLTPTKAPPPTSMSTKVVASVPLSAMLQIGKLIQPTVEIVTVKLEEFKLSEKSWGQPFEVTLSLSKEKFASGSFRDAYLTEPLSGISSGKYVLKRFKADQLEEIKKLFKSIEEHTRKVVQMNALSRNFAIMQANEAPVEYGPPLCYTKVYFGKLYGECITVENYLEGEFQKYINNTGDVFGDSELTMKAEAFSHFTYQKSGQQLMVVDIQGVGHQLFDPEIATSTLMDDDMSIFFCCGNLSTQAITKFKAVHVCNKFCNMLELKKM